MGIIKDIKDLVRKYTNINEGVEIYAVKIDIYANEMRNVDVQLDMKALECPPIVATNDEDTINELPE
jgi:hypothetical protein